MTRWHWNLGFLATCSLLMMAGTHQMGCVGDEAELDPGAGNSAASGGGGDGGGGGSTVQDCGNGTVEPPEACDDGGNLNGDGCSADCFSDESCGNGVVDVVTGEACDDGNNDDGDGCQADCSLPNCGDGALDPGEACDDGNKEDGDGCNATCTSDETCGNDVIDASVGEQCDDGNNDVGDGCSVNCQLEFCGNEIIDPGEVCDDHNNLSGDGCSGDCKSDESCGNGIHDVAAGEACDDGNNVDGDGCQANCSLASCGDGIDDPNEACDDGNNVSGDGCNATCTSDETCSNNVVDTAAGEECDDGNLGGGDGCSALCQLEICGNGTTDPGEVCDDDNTISGDGCSGDCKSNESCGNSVTDSAVGEQCDDGNQTSGDGCSSSCKLEFCGNGTTDPAEECDDGNNQSGDGCSGDCQSDESCGNGVHDVAVGEQCDDGNNIDGDGCQANCSLPSCGDGSQDAGEVCDDGNNIDGDGCNATCTSNETCGNSVIDGPVGEQCDDGNVVPADGCSGICQLEVCGNSTIDPGEVCDDGNVNGGDGCSGDCSSNETCGNSTVDISVGEQCDDGNQNNGDGCSSSCQVESCIPTVLFTDDFADNSKGWLLTGTFSIGPAVASLSCSVCGQDPAADHTSSADEGLAGQNIGGCSSGTSGEPGECVTSPPIDISGAPGIVYIDYWRHGHLDYLPFQENQIEVWDGSAWVELWVNDTYNCVNDTVWFEHIIDVTAYKNSGFMVRFCSENLGGAFNAAGWSIDDLSVLACN